MYSRTQTSHLSSPTPGYLVPTIRFAAYLALVCCLATARLTTGVLSCLSIVLVLTHPHTQTCCYLVAHGHTLSVHSQTHCHPILHYQTCLPNLTLTPRAYLFLHTLSGLLPMFSQAYPGPIYSCIHYRACCLCFLKLAP